MTQQAQDDPGRVFDSFIQKYGKIVSCRVLGMRLVLISDVQLVKECLQVRKTCVLKIQNKNVGMSQGTIEKYAPTLGNELSL